jgi:hypothetical protein
MADINALVYGCRGFLNKIIAVGEFHHLAEVHHRHTVRDMLDHAQVVRDEQIGETEFLLQVFQNIQHLRLDGHIQRRDRLIANNKLGTQRQRARNTDTLTLTAGKFMRIAAGVIIFEAPLF